MDWIIVREILSITGDICLFLITVYTFYLTVYPKKLKFTSLTRSFSVFDGDYFVVALENRALSSVTVNKIELIVDDKYRVTLYDDKSDSNVCVVEPFKTLKVKMEPFSEICTLDDSQIDLDSRKVYLVVSTSRGEQYLPAAEERSRFLRWKTRHNKELQNTMVLRHYFNDLIVKKCAKYAVTYFDRSHERHTVFISETGVMSAAPFGYNVLSPELVANFEELKAFLYDEFKKYDLPFSLDEVNF